MEEFKYMDETVDAICKSLREDPHTWEFSVNTFRKKGTNIKYWNGSGGAITQTWNGHDTTFVFSYTQGQKIASAYQTARSIQASEEQRRVMQAFKNGGDNSDSPSTKKWGEFWK